MRPYVLYVYVMGLINNLPIYVQGSEERMIERAHQLKGEVRRRMFEAGGEAMRSEAGDDALRRRVWQRRGARRRALGAREAGL
jgi:hypothetical protein